MLAVVVAAATLASGPAVKIPVASPAAIAKATVESLCLKPGQSGLHRSVSGSISIGAQTNQIISKFINGRLNASGGGENTVWSGLKQEDIGPAAISYNECAEKIYPRALAEAHRALSRAPPSSGNGGHPTGTTGFPPNSSLAATEPVTPPQISCPNGVCAGQNIFGNPTVNNNYYGKPERHLSQGQISYLRDVAKSACAERPHIDVTAANSDHEAQVYGSEIAQMLKGAGCDAALSLPIPGMEPTVRGIFIGVRGYPSIPDGARRLGEILSGAQIPFEFAPIKADFFPDDQFVLAIGSE